MYATVVNFFVGLLLFTGILCGGVDAACGYDVDLCELDKKAMCYKKLVQDSSSEAFITVQSEMIGLIMKISQKINTLSCHDLAQHFSQLMSLNIRNKLWEVAYEKMIYDRLLVTLRKERVFLLLSSHGYIFLMPQFYGYMSGLEIPVHHDEKQGVPLVFCTPLNKKAEAEFFASLGVDRGGIISQLSGCFMNMCKKTWNRSHVQGLGSWSDLRVG